jgi:hypothetical protein
MYQGPCQHGPGNVTRQCNEGNLLDRRRIYPANLPQEELRQDSKKKRTEVLKGSDKKMGKSV